MAHVRKVRTTSGAVAVQVARKDNGRVVVLAHLGSAHIDAELGGARNFISATYAILYCKQDIRSIDGRGDH
ncbi:hypothetical protein BST12_10700 [Mycobacterium angelicum]|uniref:Uncharacterized protein n=1 Tax=Mycobacterium angelicum TaxID=470074 RepID=A0A1W9ZVR7_MYCAN|nr:hypothetical protein BST12_10700 [Mycobacterium angelicum]